MNHLKNHGPGFMVQKTISDLRVKLHKRSSGINIAGYISYILGNGVTARAFARIVDRSGIPFVLIDLDAGSHPLLPPGERRGFDLRLVREPRFDTTLIFANGNALKDLFVICPGLARSRRKAAVWWWEFEDGMDENLPGFEYIDEVVVFSEFTERAVRRIVPEGKKLTKLPYPFNPDWESAPDRSSELKLYGIEPDRTVFYFNFDFASSYRRKNPDGIMEAFKRAFTSRDNVHLIIKTTNHAAFPDHSHTFRQAIARHPLKDRISWIHRPLASSNHYRLLSSIDCYVSLHRGEGLGLGMLESMYMGKVVIATDYGGNMEFTGTDNALLVESRLLPCRDDYVVYRNVTLWAEPDIDQAAVHMRCIHDNPEARIAIGRKARQDILARFNPDNCVEPYRKWIKGLFDQ